MDIDPKIGKEACDFFTAEWARVPMGPSEFIDRAWGRLIAATDRQFGHGYGEWAAKMWDYAARERMTSKAR